MDVKGIALTINILRPATPVESVNRIAELYLKARQLDATTKKGEFTAFEEGSGLLASWDFNYSALSFYENICELLEKLLKSRDAEVLMFCSSRKTFQKQILAKA